VDLFGIGSAGEVLGDGGEVGSGLGSASGEVGLSGVLMLEGAGFVDHSLVVGLGGAGNGAVPVQGGEIVCGSGLVGELDEGLLGGRWCRRWLVLGDGGGRRECQSKQREESLRVVFVGVHAFDWNPHSIGTLAAPARASCFA
jgi:hypothetical protein